MADDTAALDALAALDRELDAGRVTLVDYWRRRAAIESGRAVPTLREPITAPAEDLAAEDLAAEDLPTETPPADPGTAPEPFTRREPTPEPSTRREPTPEPSNRRDVGPRTPEPAHKALHWTPSGDSAHQPAPAPTPVAVAPQPAEETRSSAPTGARQRPNTAPGPAVERAVPDGLTVKPAPSYQLDEPVPPPAPTPAAQAAPPDRTAEDSGLRPAAHSPFAPSEGAVNIPFTPTWTPEPEPDPPWRRALRGTQSSRAPQRGKLPRRWGQRRSR